MRALWAIAGTLALAAGTIGVFLPLIPTVPFVILAAFCYARGSERLHDWLVAHPTFGKAIEDWRAHGAISKRGKVLSAISLMAAFLLSLAFGVRPLILGIQAVVLGCVALFIWTRPTSQ